MYLEFNKKISMCAIKLMACDFNVLKVNQLKEIKDDLLDLHNETESLKQTISADDVNNNIVKFTIKNIDSFQKVVNITLEKIKEIETKNVNNIINQVKELL